MDMRTPPGSHSNHRDWIRAARAQSDQAERNIAALPDSCESNPSLLAANSIPGFQIEREIHRGAQGTVYRALQIATGRQVALKLLHEQSLGGPLDRARFEREVRALAALRHPNIVAIHDSGNRDGRLYIVMDYIAGSPLDVYVAQRNRAIPEILDLMLPICDAVHAAHIRGIIHRDLKPANVRVDGGGRPFVLDFGLAKVELGSSAPPLRTAPGSPAASGSSAADGLTLAGQFLGSLPWAAPEQARGDHLQVDTRTDVYSLGMLLFHMLTGRFPYPVGESMPRTLESITHHPPASPRSLRHDIDDELDTIVLKCLSKENDRRYATAGDLARDIRHYRAREPIEAKRDSRWYRTRVFLRRNRLPLAAAAASLSALLLAFALALGQWRAAVLDRDRAELAEKRQSVERRRAEDQNRKLQRVNRFVEELLASADPEALPAGDITARMLLDNASRDAESGALRDQPEVEAAVRTTLGRAYTTLARFEQAGAHLDTALRLIEQAESPDPIALGDVLYALTYLRTATRDFEAAEVSARRCIAARTAAYGESHADVAEAWDALSHMLSVALRLDEARAAMEKSVQIWRAALGDAHPRVGRAMARLAQFAHDPDESIELLQSAVARFESADGRADLHYAETLSDLARMQHLRRDYAAAEHAYQRAIAVRRAAIGGWNVAALTDLDNVTLLYLQRGDAQRAFESADELVTETRLFYGSDSPRTGQVLMHLASACRRLGEFERGLTAAEEALAIQDRSGNGATIDGLHARLGVAGLALRCGRIDLAEHAARECLNAPPDVLTMQPWREPLAQFIIGSVLVDRVSFVQAEPLLLTAYEGLAPYRRAAPPDSLEAVLGKLVELYERWDLAAPMTGKAESAAQWRSVLQQLP